MRFASSYFAYLGLFVGLGCSAADPGVENLVRSDFRDASLLGSDGSKPSGNDGAPPPPPSDSGMQPIDAGFDAGPNAFTGANAYASMKPMTSAKQHHNANMVNVVPGKGTACLGCHNGNAKAFVFAGTVFQDKAGTMPAADVEIRLRSTDGATVVSAHSDNDGNFWAVGNNLNATSNCGARSAMNVALMNGTITSGDCNDSACHGGNQGVVHVP